MKALCRFLIPAVFLCFFACTDDFATPDAKSDFISVTSDQVKPSETTGDSGDGETAGGDEGLIKASASARDLRAGNAQKMKAKKGN